jgi:hypothetical protein
MQYGGILQKWMVYKVEYVKATVDELAVLAIDGADLGICHFDVAQADVAGVHLTSLR